MEPNKILKADFLDILFEGRNKAYGAYELRKTYDKRVRNAIIGTIVVLLLIFTWYTIAEKLAEEARLHPKPKIEDLKLTDIKLPDANQPPPPPPPPPAPEPPKVKSSVQFTPPKVVKDEDVKPEEQPPDLDQIKNKAISTRNIKGDPNGIDPNLIQDSRGTGVTAAAPTNQVFNFVEQMPRFPGSINDEDSNNKIMAFLHKNIQYPTVAKENNIQGVVTVTFVVSNDGSIRDVKTVGAPKGGGLEEEAIHVVKMMPHWLPGKQNGRAVNVQFTLPVHFQLQ